MSLGGVLICVARTERPWGPRVCDARVRYRARYDAGGGAAITQDAERLVAESGDEGLTRVLELAAQLQSALTQDAHALWLELEEELHRYWGEVAAAHYALGVERRGTTSAQPASASRARLYALARSLLEIADELE